MLFNEFIVWYLFLGGLGAGLYLVIFIVELLSRNSSMPWGVIATTTRKSALIISFAVIVVGSIFLMKDLGRLDKVHLLFAQPTFSVISLGSFVLAGLAICLGLLIVLSWKTKGAPKALIRGVELIAAVLSLITIIYTGVFLNSIAAVPFWTSILIPILFFLSSLSSGIGGIALIYVYRNYSSKNSLQSLKILLRADSIILALELVAVTILAIQSTQSNAAYAAVELLVGGTLAYHFWLGFIGCGIVIPLFMELILLSYLSKNTTFYVVLGGLIIVGGFYLRYCTIFSGEHLSAFMFA